MVSKMKTSIVNWKESVKQGFWEINLAMSTLNVSYGVLRIFQKLKHFTDFQLVNVIKRLPELLV